MALDTCNFTAIISLNIRVGLVNIGMGANFHFFVSHFIFHLTLDSWSSYSLLFASKSIFHSVSFEFCTREEHKCYPYEVYRGHV